MLVAVDSVNHYDYSPRLQGIFIVLNQVAVAVSFDDFAALFARYYSIVDDVSHKKKVLT